MYGAIFEELNVLSFELYSIQHVRATALNLYSDVPFCVLLPVENKWKVLNHFPAWAITVFGYHHSHCIFSKASLVLFTGFAYIFFVNMELNCVFLIDLVIVIQLGICNDGLTEIEYYQLK